MRYLLDTNVLSEPVKPKPDPRLLKWFERHGDECVTAAPVIEELLFGISRLPPSRRRDDLERYLEGVVLAAYPVLPYDERAAQWHGRERARLSSMGLVLPTIDGFIAAVARVHDLVLITENLKDFRHWEGLQVESWKK